MIDYKIKFGTDGWREIIADNYTVDNVLRVSQATAEWINEQYKSPVVTIGYDCRFGGKMFAEYVAKSFASQGIKVYLGDKYATTPMVSLANVILKADIGVVITASHNPPAYNGFKLKAAFGGPLLPEDIAQIEALIPQYASRDLPEISGLIEDGNVVLCDFESMYIDHVNKHFDMDLVLTKSGNLIYDAMYGAGQGVVKKLLPNAHLLHCTLNPSFNNVAPEPIAKNLQVLSNMIESTHGLDYGLATDGDADRIGFFDGKGNFVDSHHLILLITHYLVNYKGYTGKVVKSFSVSNKVEKLAKKLGLETITTKIGFKYICKHMVEDDVLIGAEESGGIAIKGHIPERDGIWMGLILLEYMAKTGKQINELVNEMYDIVGPFAVERYDLLINNEQKESIIANCIAGSYKKFGVFNVQSVEDLDGFKFHLPGEEWVMIRPSGTEPVLRIYAESFDSKGAFAILDAVKETILA